MIASAKVLSAPPGSLFAAPPLLSLQKDAYAELKRPIKSEGLVERQPRYDVFQILATVGLVGLGVFDPLCRDGMLQSYRERLRHLSSVSTALRLESSR